MQILLKKCYLKTNLPKGPRNKTEEKQEKKGVKGREEVYKYY